MKQFFIVQQIISIYKKTDKFPSVEKLIIINKNNNLNYNNLNSNEDTEFKAFA